MIRDRKGGVYGFVSYQQKTSIIKLFDCNFLGYTLACTSAIKRLSCQRQNQYR